MRFSTRSMYAVASRFEALCRSLSLPVLTLIVFAIPSAAADRAVWVRPFVSATQPTRKDPVEARKYIRTELERIKRAGFNVVFLETFWDGYSIYPSRVVPQRPLSIPYGVARKDEAGQTETYDVLQFYIDEAEKLGIRVDAWMHIFHQWSTNLGDPSKSPIFSKFPEWMALDINGSPLVKSEAEGANREVDKVFMSPSNAGVRRLLVNVMREMVAKYPKLGGVQLDYIRYPLHYPETPFDYSADSLAQFKKDTGLDAKTLKSEAEKRQWQDWKTLKVTEVVKLVSDEVRKSQPKWQISVAVFPDFENTLKVKMQDSRDWAAKGYIDAFYPMCYSPNFDTVDRWAKEFRREIKPPMKVYLTLYVTHFYKNNALDERFLNVEKKYGYDGLAIFASQLLTDDLAEKLGVWDAGK
ncbi:MAG: family 10 glycosylhydrolase [Acidobacteria bacterium]|nr:family 10 glycosylhydrolase [Acidobacteriota bacterium]